MQMTLYMNLMEKNSAVKGENLRFIIGIVKLRRLGCWDISYVASGVVKIFLPFL